jgi:outer membrane protein assembly factor BamE (lipoprotein component of BamABCDE complex)
MRHLLALVLLCAPAACLSQEKSKTVSPGMTEAQVVEALGQPATKRKNGDRTFLFYANTCGKNCGMNDLVILTRDSVSDAIFRSADRRYTGTSSSPESLSAKEAAKAAPASEPIRMKPPEKASDATPSIPVSPPTMKPATASPTPQHTP